MLDDHRHHRRVSLWHTSKFARLRHTRLRGEQFEGLLDYRECVIQSRYKDEKRQLFAEEIVFRNGFWAREGAYRMDGELAFGLEEHQFYRYRRVP